jgi:hypothetical protein
MKAKKLIQMFEMAFSKNNWIDNVRDRYLGGALGEYAKIIIGREVGIKDYWSNEVSKILLNVTKYMSKKIKTKSNFDRDKAFKEAFREASTFQFQITDARNELSDKFPEKYRSILKTNGKYDSKILLQNMLKEYLPDLYDKIKDI